ncbi:hypothetical protein CDAR_250571 [Caerostris darwini]|uniref:Uncharacterized protein n=1 Tax=Caerostris darwini TaxID=1538125 RepID=A0AAV4UEB2_9ARAC|nr:hypothetical protein CDAR_250571 [Caerostris darwini]
MPETSGFGNCSLPNCRQKRSPSKGPCRFSAVDGLLRPIEGAQRLISSSNSRNTIRSNPSPDIGSHHFDPPTPPPFRPPPATGCIGIHAHKSPGEAI